METEEELISEKMEKRKSILKKVRNISLIILFNIIFPYVIFLISNINNVPFLEAKKSQTTLIHMVYELVVIYGFYSFFKAIFRKSLYSNIALAILLNIISIISFYKINVVAKPFWPEDILLAGNAVEIAGYGNIKFEPIIGIQIFLTIILIIVQLLITNYTKYENKLKNISRIILGIVSVAIICIACLFNWTSIKGFEQNDYNNKRYYYVHGAAVEFFRNFYKLVEKPKLETYSKEKLEEIKQEAENLNNSTIEEETPNIITIMAESFTDITKVETLKFKDDPLPTYRNLIKKYPHGNTVVSIFGGETSMSEFEFLTGSSTKFLNGKKYPYTQIVKSDTISVASILKEHGYATTAIHANEGDFYNRDTAYKYLRFDNLIFEENMQIDNIYEEQCVSDMDTAEEIIKQYENMGENKKFIFAITMESHVPYNSTKYPQNNISIVPTKKVDLLEFLDIETYSQGLYNLDQSLKYLVEYFENKDEKVMIVLFGDHLPAFNNLYDEEYGESIERYETPYLIWTNYEMTRRRNRKL